LRGLRRSHRACRQAGTIRESGIALLRGIVNRCPALEISGDVNCVARKKNADFRIHPQEEPRALTTKGGDAPLPDVLMLIPDSFIRFRISSKT
jgi:hypothetical protein